MQRLIILTGKTLQLWKGFIAPTILSYAMASAHVEKKSPRNVKLHVFDRPRQVAAKVDEVG